MNRRHFLKSIAAAAPVAALGYGFAETGDVRIERVSAKLPNLPLAFDGTTVAFLTDIHHGPYVTLAQVQSFVRTALALQPDLIVLGGDYSLRHERFIAPCLDVLSSLRAPLGVYGVLGNHDYWHGLDETRAGLKRAKIEELTNRGVWLKRGSDRLRLAGVDDLWCGTVDVAAAVGETNSNDVCLLLSHNPDVAETLADRRVGLMLSGHTHGGQMTAPGIPNPFTPSNYGDKYARGMVDAPATRVYVSRGLGTTGVPIRYNCPPEISLITLRS